MESLLLAIVSGLANGSVYGLVGLSLALIYVSSKVINFAQGEFVMLGAMSTVLFLGSLKFPPALAVVAVIGVALAGGLGIDRLVYAPLFRRADPLTVMIGTFAASVMLAGGALVIWGPVQQVVPSFFSQTSIVIGDFVTTWQQISIIAAFLGFLALIWGILYKTNFGLTMRAVGVDAKVAQLMGVRSDRVIQFTFLLSASISACAGMLVGPLLGGHPSMGVLITVKGFMAAILGGLGSPFAAAAGGLLIGVLEALVASYGNSFYAEPTIFGVILVVLLIRPYGLLGEFEAMQR